RAGRGAPGRGRHDQPHAAVGLHGRDRAGDRRDPPRAPLELPHAGLRGGGGDRGAVRAAGAGDRRRRLRCARRRARAARGRAAGAPLRPRRRGARLLLGRQAARRPAGGPDRRARRCRRVRLEPPAGPGAADRQALAGGAGVDARALPGSGACRARGARARDAADAARGARAQGAPDRGRERGRGGRGLLARRRRRTPSDRSRGSRRERGPRGERGGRRGRVAARARPADRRADPRRAPAGRSPHARREGDRVGRGRGAGAGEARSRRARDLRQVNAPGAPLTLGTAGHIDHGKSALVHALTGGLTDRLPEERRRGMTIALGYTQLTLPGGRTVSVIDVPGHERLVRTMVAGASGIDMYLLVVAADDGVMPQTREHARIVRALDVHTGVVAVTKSDLADPGRAAREAAELLPGVPVLACSTRTGTGLDELAGAIERVASDLPARAAAEGETVLHIDRVFSIRGAGTVVTGTLWSGEIAAGDRVRLLPAAREARVRGVQVHDLALERAR